MNIIEENANGWKNQQGTGERAPCSCDSWMKHWENYYSGTGINKFMGIHPQPIWPTECSVFGCSKKPTLGAHVIKLNCKLGDIVINPHLYIGEQIVPMCISCNNDRSQEFNLKVGVVCVSANINETCKKVNVLLDTTIMRI